MFIKFLGSSTFKNIMNILLLVVVSHTNKNMINGSITIEFTLLTVFRIRLKTEVPCNSALQFACKRTSGSFSGIGASSVSMHYPP